MAAYNGAEFIREQLDSIREQTLPPDEVIIADDCSTDGTYELCREYIAGNNLAGWTVYQNPGNLGVRRNFREALMKCTGDYVFTCDQDDIWIPGKIHAVADGLYLLNRQLVLYRRHGGNATNQFSRIPPNITQRLQGIDSDSAMYAGFLEAADGLSIPEHNRKALSRHIEFLRRRRKVLQSRSPVTTATFVFMNLKRYPTFRNALSDIYDSLKLRE